MSTRPSINRSSSSASSRSSASDAASVRTATYTDITTPSSVTSPGELWGPSAEKSSYFLICTNCHQDDASFYQCLSCEANKSPSTNLCNHCYIAGFAKTHSHDETHFINATDPVVPDMGRSSASDCWKTRMNVQGRLWYQHKEENTRTFVRPQ